MHSPTSEDLLRWTLAATVVLTILVAVYHRRKAHTGEPISRREEGFAFAITLRVVGVLCEVAMLLYLVAPSTMQWAAVALPMWLRWSGLGLAMLGMVLLGWTLHSLGGNLTDTVVTRNNAVLVTRGPYRYVRHPFYVTAAMLFLGASLASANVFIGATGLVAMIMLVIRTRKEEEQLVLRFGDEYRRYMQATGRFWPKLRRRAS